MLGTFVGTSNHRERSLLSAGGRRVRNLLLSGLKKIISRLLNRCSSAVRGEQRVPDYRFGRCDGHHKMVAADDVAQGRALRESGITRAELMRRLGWKHESVDRLFRLDHASRLDQIEAAFKALGKSMALEVEEAGR
jgi:hypothetical protein